MKFIGRDEMKKQELLEKFCIGDCILCNPGGGGRIWKTAITRKDRGLIAIGALCDECEAWSDMIDGKWKIPDVDDKQLSDVMIPINGDVCFFYVCDEIT